MQNIFSCAPQPHWVFRSFTTRHPQPRDAQHRLIRPAFWWAQYLLCGGERRTGSRSKCSIKSTEWSTEEHKSEEPKVITFNNNQQQTTEDKGYKYTGVGTNRKWDTGKTSWQSQDMVWWDMKVLQNKQKHWAEAPATGCNITPPNGKFQTQSPKQSPGGRWNWLGWRWQPLRSQRR